MSDNMNARIKKLGNLIKAGDSLDARLTISESGDMVLLKYSRDCQFGDSWNWIEAMSRGTIFNKVTGECVVLPFEKFYNWGQGGRNTRASIKTVTKKMDGSLGILYRASGQYKVATTGSFQSNQGEWATQRLNSGLYNLDCIPDKLTLLFEIIYPENRIVVDYNGLEDLVLLAARNRFTGEYLEYYPDLYELGHWLNMTLVETVHFNNVSELIALTGQTNANQEGWVVEFMDGRRFKFKGDDYVTLHRFISSFSAKRIASAWVAGIVSEFLINLPDELDGEVRGIVSSLEVEEENIHKQLSEYLEVLVKMASRKEQAMWIKRCVNEKDLHGLIFGALDQRQMGVWIRELASSRYLETTVVENE